MQGIIEPTQENIIESLRKPFSTEEERILSFFRLLSSNMFNQLSPSIVIDGKWGSGKTFHVKRLELILNALLDNNTKADQGEQSDQTSDKIRSILENNEKLSVLLKQDTKVYPVYYNAWKSDNVGDPLLSVVQTFFQSKVLSIVERKAKAKEEFTEIIKILKNLLAVGSLVPGAGSVLGGVKTIIESIEGMLASGRTEDNLEKKFANALDTLLSPNEHEKPEKVLLIVDELDRCKPTFAVSVLERMKHYFTHKNLIILFVTDVEKLSFVIKKEYGYDDNAAALYLNRFFEIVIPYETTDQDVYNLVAGEIEKNKYGRVLDVLSWACKKYDLSYREAIELRLSVDHIFNWKPTYRDLFILFLFCYTKGFKLSKPCEYNTFINQTEERVSEVVEIYNSNRFLKEIIRHSYDESSYCRRLKLLAPEALLPKVIGDFYSKEGDLIFDNNYTFTRDEILSYDFMSPREGHPINPDRSYKLDKVEHPTEEHTY